MHIYRNLLGGSVAMFYFPLYWEQESQVTSSDYFFFGGLAQPPSRSPSSCLLTSQTAAVGGRAGEAAEGVVGRSCFACGLVYHTRIWLFPKIEVPPNHPFMDGFSLINHPFWGTPMTMETPYPNSWMHSVLLDLWCRFFQKFPQIRMCSGRPQCLQDLYQ